MTTYIPVTPAGTILVHLEANTETQAWKNLLEDAAHMPYDGVQGFKERGYTVVSDEPHLPRNDETMATHFPED